MSPIFVGELNPYAGDKSFALYDYPETSAGARLRKLICQVPSSTYRAFTRYNLCEGSWSAPKARAEAIRLTSLHMREPRTWVLLGVKVRSAFAWVDPKDERFIVYKMDLAAGSLLRAGYCADQQYLLLPHPSGLCREWDTPGTFERAQAALKLACPEIPWNLEAARFSALH